QNKFAPVTRDGKVLGLKLLFVPQGNFLYELGARSGDIIRRFNGEPLENQDRMIQMWQSLQSANRITIEVERGGKVIPFEILIQ
ncbi:MAG TPA: general secretion pathway protein GspC, partial [Leptospiraceae bacterium]|nr:general secretion pathway protein GspC [Leptospiraceae bacterium]